MHEVENKNRRVGLLTSAGVHIVVFLALFFVVAWRAPDPPLPEYGIELNFGLDDEGSGEIQPDQPVGDEDEAVDAGAKKQTTTSEPADVAEDVKNPAVEKATEQVLSKTESPVVVKEEKEQGTPRQESNKPENQAVRSDATESIKEVPKEAVTADALKKGAPGSHGDDVAKPGDKGSAEGKLDANALYGTPGGGAGGTGMNLQMAGWAWAEKPILPELPDNENGMIEFNIECDENGDITKVTTATRGLSLKAEQLLRDVIFKSSLVRERSAGKAQPLSRGSIVFVLITK